MKTKLLALIAVAYLCLVLPAIVHAENFIEFNSWNKGPGEFYRNKIAESELRKMPSWAPEEGAPPLSIKQAVDIARAYLKKNHPAFANAVISEVKLVQFVVPQYYKNKWCYIIVFMNNVPVVATRLQPMDVLVMMNGKVNEPEVVNY